MTLKLGVQHRVLKYYQVCSNDDPGITLTYFTAMSNLVPYAFVLKKGKTMDFSETIVVSDVKIGRCSQLNEYMKLYEYQRSRSFIDIGPNLSDSIFSNFYSSITTRSIEAKFHVEPQWYKRTGNVFKWSRSHDQDGRHAHIWEKPIKIFFTGTERLMTLKLGMQHKVLKNNQIYSNNAPGLTLIYFTAKLNLVPYAFVWEKVNGFFRNYCSLRHKSW